MAAYNCLSPLTVKGKNGVVKVPCGKCAACIARKSQSLANRCTIESQQSKYVYFVTLTYSDDYLPLCRVVRTGNSWTFVDVSNRDCVGNLLVWDDCPIMSIVPLSTFDSQYFKDYYKKLHLSYNGLIPYLSRRDYQLFLKRLRINIHRYFKKNNIKEDETIRYYVCGEYGPVHFRPHFHVLLFTNSESVSECLGSCVSKSWQFGRIDFQASQGNCSGYVAKYINSLSRLSAIQRLKAFRPFSSHSRFFASSFYQDVYQEVGKDDFERVVRKGLIHDGKFRNVFPWLAFEADLFPKCYGYGQADSNVRLFCYTAYERCCKELGQTQVSSMSSDMAALLFSSRPTPFLKEFCSVFDGYFDRSKAESTFNSLLYTSKKFLRLCRTYNMSPYAYLRVIEDYYSSKDIYQLNNQLQSQVDFIAKYGKENIMWLLSWYANFEPIRKHDILSFDDECERLVNMLESPTSFCDPRQVSNRLRNLLVNTPFHYSDGIMAYLDSIGLAAFFVTDDVFYLSVNPVWCDFKSRTLKNEEYSIKHKKLQDLNNIFTYGKHNVNEECAE